jgi:predicted trehalose synthase
VVEIPGYLESWIQNQRWYAGKGRAPEFELIGSFDLDGAADSGARIRIDLVLDHAEHPVLYQVPLTERDEPLEGAEKSLIAAVMTDDSIAQGTTHYLYDGPHDPAFAAAMLRLVLDESSFVDSSGTKTVTGHRDLGTDLQIVSSKVLSGEQSNTSIVFVTAGSDGSPAMPVICKLFRALHDGNNPDVELTGVLGAAGSAVVPRVVGHLTGQWSDTAKLHGIATGHLAFAQEFLPGTEDAWRVAVRAAEEHEDFSERARALGVTTAEMHETLASALPSAATTPADIASVIESMRRRFDLAVREVPSLADHAAHLESVYERAAASPWLPLQRIHGDYHLGQVLSVAERGWVVLDFEGEPLRPMNERNSLDSPLRDVAGMLRSFDYVAGSFALGHPGQSVADWTTASRHAFVDGYIERSGHDIRAHRAVLDAFEIDKALYEAIYEARNRPAWLSIPTDAITRLVERVSAA